MTLSNLKADGWKWKQKEGTENVILSNILKILRKNKFFIFVYQVHTC
jgi:hypothetical protein